MREAAYLFKYTMDNLKSEIKTINRSLLQINTYDGVHMWFTTYKQWDENLRLGRRRYKTVGGRYFEKMLDKYKEGKNKKDE